jgi:hypothetical protein
MRVLLRTFAKRGHDRTPTRVPCVLCCLLAAFSRARLRLIALAAFVLAPTGGGCSLPFLRLDYETACEHAAVVANKTYVGSVSLEGYPAGCYWHTVNAGVYFNGKGAIATANSFALQMCAGAPIPAHRYATHATERGIRQEPPEGPRGSRSRHAYVKCVMHARPPACPRASVPVCIKLCLHAFPLPFGPRFLASPGSRPVAMCTCCEMRVQLRRQRPPCYQTVLPLPPCFYSVVLWPGPQRRELV